MKFKVGDRVIPIRPIEGNGTVVGVSGVVQFVESGGITILFDKELKNGWGPEQRNWFCTTRNFDSIKHLSGHKEFTDEEYEALLV